LSRRKSAIRYNSQFHHLHQHPTEPNWQPTGFHLTATRLRRPGYVQQGLFEPPDAQARAVAKVKREINAKVGRFAVRSGATLPLCGVYRDREQGFDVCDIRGKLCF
jgi:DNA polymerase V